MNNELIRNLENIILKYKGLIRRSYQVPVDIVSYLSGVEQRIVRRPHFVRRWSIPIQVMTEDERRALLELYGSTLGSGVGFPFADPADNSFDISFVDDTSYARYGPINPESFVSIDFAKRDDKDTYIIFCIVLISNPNVITTYANAALYKTSRSYLEKFISNATWVKKESEDSSKVTVRVYNPFNQSIYLLVVTNSYFMPQPDWVDLSNNTARPRSLIVGRWIGDVWDEFDYIRDVSVKINNIPANFEIRNEKIILLLSDIPAGATTVIQGIFEYHVRFGEAIMMENMTFDAPGLYNVDALVLEQVRRQL